MSALKDFLMQGRTDEQVTTEVRLARFPAPFVIRSITEAQNKALRKASQRVVFDKKTRAKNTELDTDLYLSKLVVACCADPDFNDAELQERYQVRGAEALLDVLLRPGEYIELVQAVQDLNGDILDIEQAEEEAKNS